MALTNYSRSLVPANGDLRQFLNHEFQKLEQALKSVFVLSGDIDMLLGAIEGDVNLVVAGSTVAGAATYSAQQFHYVKIGRLVAIFGRITWTGHTGTGNIRIRGLPFTISAVDCPGVLQTVGATIPSSDQCYFDHTINDLVVNLTGNTGGQAMVAAGDLLITGIYVTNS